MSHFTTPLQGAQWLSDRVLDSRPKGRGFEPHQCHCVVSLSKNINPRLVLVQPRKARPYITEILLMGRTESNQTNKQNNATTSAGGFDYQKNEAFSWVTCCLVPLKEIGLFPYPPNKKSFSMYPVPFVTYSKICIISK